MKQPAYLVVRQKIERALRKKPTDSDRQIASGLHTSHVTVGKVRKTLKLRNPNAKRVGKDGIARSLPYTEGDKIPGIYGELWEYLAPNADFRYLLDRVGCSKLTASEHGNVKQLLIYLQEKTAEALQRIG